ncbi:CBS domain-containing protein [Phosphitispora sp. TUW77]|uniref:CBS domain-containing protein n=1 Tax=Phosphitispora sp. TUW77 TaxID=3152361 RepID=UPI003AB6FF78
MEAKDIMTADVITVSPDDTVEHVIKLLLDKKISGVPVLNKDREVIGIVTEGDLMLRSQELRVPSYIQILGGVIYLDDPAEFKDTLRKVVAVKVEGLMTEDPITVDEDTDLEEIATIMADNGINRVPVTREGKLVGIISRADIIRSLAMKNPS